MPRYYSDHHVFAHPPKTSTEPPQPVVYMLTLTDGLGFKLGRTENLLQRISSFSIRYFEDSTCTMRQSSAARLKRRLPN